MKKDFHDTGKKNSGHGVYLEFFQRVKALFAPRGGLSSQNIVKGFIVTLLAMGLIQCTGNHKLISPVGLSMGGADALSYDQVQPIFKKSCSGCHNGQVQPDWNEYEEVIQRVQNGILVNKIWNMRNSQLGMPPPNSDEGKAMLEEDRLLIKKWAEEGGRLTADEPVVVVAAPEPSTPLLRQCQSCHGEYGVPASFDQAPNLAAQNREYLLGELKSFQAKKRLGGTMTAVVANMDEGDMEEMATYFSLISLKAYNLRDKPSISDEELQRRIAEGSQFALRNNCNSCHLNSDFQANSPQWPNLVGQKVSYMLTQYNDFLSEKRPGFMMPRTFKTLVENQKEYDAATEEEQKKMDESGMSRINEDIMKSISYYYSYSDEFF